MLPLDALNIIYPIEGLEELANEVMSISDYSSVSDESSEEPPLTEYKRTEKAKSSSSAVLSSSSNSDDDEEDDDEEDEDVDELIESLNNIEIVKKQSDEPSVTPFDYKPVEKPASLSSEASSVSSQKKSGEIIPTNQESSFSLSKNNENFTTKFKIPSSSSASSMSSSSMSGGLSESSYSSSDSSSKSKNIFINIYTFSYKL